jgi:ubiquinone/menaquinone biosynthesis C-methylase UbiE
MSSQYDLKLFEGAAEYYARYRPKYPRAAFDFIKDRFQLGPSCRILDLGCGTGNASIPLASEVAEVVAMDPNPEMIRVGAELAESVQARNIKWLQAGSKDLSPALGAFRLVLMGQSFHWMDRDRVLRDLYEIVEDGGGLALIGPGHGLVLIGHGPAKAQESWEPVAERVVRKYLGERSRRRRVNSAEPRHESALQRSKFEIAEYHEFASELDLGVDSILGRLYSYSGNLRKSLGEHLGEFEAELRAELLLLRPGGQFAEQAATGVLAALKRTK